MTLTCIHQIESTTLQKKKENIFEFIFRLQTRSVKKNKKKLMKRKAINFYIIIINNLSCIYINIYIHTYNYIRGRR